MALSLPLRAALLAAALAALGCSRGDAQRAADSDAPRAGEWEVTSGVVDLSGLGLSAEEEAELLATSESQFAPDRRCLRGGRPRVGDPFLGGQCSYSRVDDDGARADRTVVCRRSEQGTVDTIRLEGSVSPDRYALRIASRRADAATGREISSVVTREEGRWIGPCREGQPPS